MKQKQLIFNYVLLMTLSFLYLYIEETERCAHNIYVINEMYIDDNNNNNHNNYPHIFPHILIPHI